MVHWLLCTSVWDYLAENSLATRLILAKHKFATENCMAAILSQKRPIDHICPNRSHIITHATTTYYYFDTLNIRHFLLLAMQWCFFHFSNFMLLARNDHMVTRELSAPLAAIKYDANKAGLGLLTNLSGMFVCWAQMKNNVKNQLFIIAVRSYYASHG